MRFLSAAILGLALLTAGCSPSQYRRGYPSPGSYPASARTSEGGQARYSVCHKGKNELTLPESAVDAHLRHGDRFGSCRDRDRDDRRDRDRRDRGNGRGNGRG